MINQTDYYFFLSIYFQVLYTVETGRELQTNRTQQKVPQGSGTAATMRKLFTMNVKLLCLSYKFTLLWVYHNSYCKRLLPWKWWNVSNNFRKTVINSYLFFFFFNLARCMIQMIILLTIQLIKWIVLVSVQLLP